MSRIAFALLITGILWGCQPQYGSRPTAALTLSSDSLPLRQMQMRRFDTTDEPMMLASVTGVLQDLGFTIDESNASTGLAVGSKERPAWGANQVIRVSVSTKRSVEASGIVVRVTFQRIFMRTSTTYSRAETLTDPTLYQRFFDNLSQSVFLEAHQI